MSRGSIPATHTAKHTSQQHMESYLTVQVINLIKEVLQRKQKKILAHINQRQRELPKWNTPLITFSAQVQTQ